MKKLFFLLLFVCGLSFSKNLVLTNTQATYSIGNALTKNTDIIVKDVFETNGSMNADQTNTFKEVDKSLLKEAKAVIDLQRVWNQDVLYEHARRENISVIEIDASYSYQDNSSLALLTDTYHEGEKKGEVNPYAWLNLNNLSKMYKIVAHDLIKIFPQNEAKIEQNLNDILLELDKYIDMYNDKVNIDGLIYTSEDLNYLISFLNIYSNFVNYDIITKENVKSIMSENELKIFLTDRPFKKDIYDEIVKNGGKVIQVKTGAFPEEDENNDELMKKDGLMNIIKDNLEQLKK